jgi:hypothetical protein
MCPRILITEHEDDEFCIYYEQYGPIRVFHSDVYKWSPSVAKRYRAAIDAIFKRQNQPVFAVRYLNDQHSDTFPHFLSWAGFKPIAFGEYDDTPCQFYVKVM